MLYVSLKNLNPQITLKRFRFWMIGIGTLQMFQKTTKIPLHLSRNRRKLRLHRTASLSQPL